MNLHAVNFRIWRRAEPSPERLASTCFDEEEDSNGAPNLDRCFYGGGSRRIR
jgi:hypothetical protein